jgi:hypothetical protein
VVGALILAGQEGAGDFKILPLHGISVIHSDFLNIGHFCLDYTYPKITNQIINNQ